ncbi:CgeB family protein [Azospira inquinata]|uniref:Glycosyltransferase n=1 Tax=Azospira inquinata TaxID=2785627 RepID=A0A975SKA9_9RHOO|nr:glycosyltransferase [Azospira inquinata]QWT46761.1 glycosyltransferase [Azospira inquinata]QWT47916.1 glycosyltransferase [Azospira inquinata]
MNASLHASPPLPADATSGLVASPKVLVSFPFHERQQEWHIPLGDGCAEALADMGFAVCRFNPIQEEIRFVGKKPLEKLVLSLGKMIGFDKRQIQESLPWGDDQVRFKALLRAVEDFRPDWLLVISTFTYPAWLLEKIRACGAKKIIGWCVEGPTWIRSPIEESHLYDHYFCIHRHGIGAEENIGFLPAVSFDKDSYYPITPRPDKCRDVVFVGRAKERRVDYVKNITDFDLHIYGPAWERCDPSVLACLKGKAIGGDALNLLYNQAKIVLNVTAWANEGQDCPNLRVVDVPATGSFLLSDYSDFAAELFVPGKEIEFFSSVEELRDKLKFYLANDGLREKIARAGYEKAISLETYRDKILTILQRSRIALPEGSISRTQCQQGVG